jgi:hypothetical protein
MHPLLRPSTLEYWLIAVPASLIAGIVLAAVSFVDLPFIG